MKSKNRFRTIVEKSLYFKDDIIFKVVNQTETHYQGFNIFTEECVEFLKVFCQPLPAFIYQLLNSEMNRVKLALAIKEETVQAIKLLDISPRTVYRRIETIRGEKPLIRYRCQTCNNTCLAPSKPDNTICGGCLNPNWKENEIQEPYKTT